jgi:hypothetical protein
MNAAVTFKISVTEYWSHYYTFDHKIVTAVKIYVHFKRTIFEYLTAGELGCKPIARFHIKNTGGDMDIYLI